MLFLLSLLLLLCLSVLGQFPVQEAQSGEYVPVHQLPYQALIRQLNYPHISQCGATLIDPEWLLSSEYCLEWSDINEVRIEAYLGVSSLVQIPYPSTGSVVKRRVVRYFRGPRIEIGNRTENSGLLLLKLDRKVETTSNIRPIELPEVDRKWRANQPAVASGYGHMYMYSDNPDNGLTSGNLHYLRASILSKRDCLKMYRKKNPYVYRRLRRKLTPESILCAEFHTEGQCFGGASTSAGPLAVCATPLRRPYGGKYDISGQLMCKDNRWLLAGVHSVGPRKCGDDMNPSFYANVPVSSEWIRRIIRSN